MLDDITKEIKTKSYVQVSQHGGHDVTYTRTKGIAAMFVDITKDKINLSSKSTNMLALTSFVNILLSIFLWNCSLKECSFGNEGIP